MADLTTRLGRLTLKNPVMPGSGTWGVGHDDHGLYDPAVLGAVVTKSIRLGRTRGNPPLRLAETPAGMLNSIGIPSPGLDVFIGTILPKVATIDTVRIISVAGIGVGEFAEAVARLDPHPGIDAFELNLSCPNLGEGRMIAEVPDLLFEAVSRARQETGKPLIAKLSPNVTDIVAMAQRARDAGADALTVANALSGMAIDVEQCRPVLGSVTGGLTGGAVRPVILRMVWQVARRVDCPVIASGGVMSATDALEYLLAGAVAVQVGTANFINPMSMPEIIRDLERWLERRGFASIAEIIGLAQRTVVEGAARR